MCVSKLISEGMKRKIPIKCKIPEKTNHPINFIRFSLPDSVKPQIVQVMLNIREDMLRNLSRYINPISKFENWLKELHLRLKQWFISGSCNTNFIFAQDRMQYLDDCCNYFHFEEETLLKLETSTMKCKQTNINSKVS